MSEEVIEIKYGFDRFGNPDWTISSDKCNVLVHSSSSFGYDGKDKAVEWIKGFLRQDGFENIVVKEVKDDKRMEQLRQNFRMEFQKFKQKYQSKELIPKKIDSIAGETDG